MRMTNASYWLETECYIDSIDDALFCIYVSKGHDCLLQNFPLNGLNTEKLDPVWLYVYDCMNPDTVCLASQ